MKRQIRFLGADCFKWMPILCLIGLSIILESVTGSNLSEGVATSSERLSKKPPRAKKVNLG
jgi:hypothetical protein